MPERGERSCAAARVYILRYSLLYARQVSRDPRDLSANIKIIVEGYLFRGRSDAESATFRVHAEYLALARSLGRLWTGNFEFFSVVCQRKNVHSALLIIFLLIQTIW